MNEPRKPKFGRQRGGGSDAGDGGGSNRSGRRGAGGQGKKPMGERRWHDGPRKSERAFKKPSLEGLMARDLAVAVLRLVLDEDRQLDDALALAVGRLPETDKRTLDPRDRAFARAIAMSVLRRRGQIYDLLSHFLDRGLPKNSGNLSHILNAAVAQLVFLNGPAHAVIHLAVEQAKRDSAARRFDRLTNAVLRRVAEDGNRIVQGQDAVGLNMPRWLLARWEAAYGADQARAIAAASLVEPPLDLATKTDAAGWAERLGGTLLTTGAVRLVDAGRIEDLAGFSEGGWWVQDAAAQLPARLLGSVDGLRVADLCAAPGGKAAELAAAGARVTAIDRSEGRLAVLAANFARLGLTVDIVAADVASYTTDAPFDAVLLDAPCSATGTIRRHPDILAMKQRADVTRLASEQTRLLEAALKLVKPGGKVVYCVCSLEPEEGPALVETVLSTHPDVTRMPVVAGEAGIAPEWITPMGDLRTLPSHFAEVGGMDGFYAARLIRR